MAIIRTVLQRKRKCSRSGKRTEGAYYFATELSPTGELPAIVEVDPPIPFDPPEGHPLGRVPIVIDLDLLLEGAPYEEFISGTSAARLRRQNLMEPEISAFGMPIERRRSSGVCAVDGLPALQDIAPRFIPIAGLCIRNLARSASDRAVAEAVMAFSRHDWPALLAALHRGWRTYPPKKREALRSAVGLMMDSIGAGADKELLN